MSLEIYKSVVSACPLFLRPIIRILLRAGITYKQFATVARNIFVEVAANEYGINGRKTNTSRIAILTGISRSEVTKIRKELENEEKEFEFPTVLSNASRILSAWHQDEAFLDSNGKPKLLPLESNKKEESFTSLVGKYGGDIPLTAMLKELKKTNSIEETDDGQLRVLTRLYLPSKYDATMLFDIGETYKELGDTSYHNFLNKDTNKSRMQGRVFNAEIPAEYYEEFHKLARAESMKLFETLDHWLTEKEISLQRTNNEQFDKSKLGLGLYLIYDPTHNQEE